ncbi:tail fiber protein [Paraglaciecola Antarctic GD virus 1]|nr:tail fiber protein [Paraglaciecola Antarctic GD virus 1]
MTTDLDQDPNFAQHKSYVDQFVEGIFNVEFEKADGSLRKMRCTRDANHIPEDDNELTKAVVVVEGKAPKKANYTALRVYEIGVGWKSFRIDRLSSCLAEPAGE